MRRSTVLATALLSLCGLSAVADTITVFDANGSFVDGAVLSGTVTIDTTNGSITAIDLIAGGPDNLNLTTLGYYTGAESLQANYYNFAAVTPGPIVPQIIIGADTTTLVNYTGGALFSQQHASGVYAPSAIQLSNLSQVNLEVGTLTPESGSTAPTPEPSALVLLGTGLCGLAGMARRRLAI